ncbi:MAG: SLC13 family permease [Planctomycetota bacterium]
MGLHAWIAVATLAAAAILFVTRRLPIGVTALGIPVVLVATGVISRPADALAGFGNQAVVAIGSIFVVGAALQESGVATLLARGLQRIGGRRETVLITLVMLATALLSSMMNNAAAVALLLPAVVTLARRAFLSPSRLLIPMAYAAVLGGTVTMIGTAPNLLVADSMRAMIEGGGASADQSIGVFTYALIGIPIVLTGVLYMTLVGRRFLPARSPEDRLREARLPEDVAQSYGLIENMFQFRVVPQSLVNGRTVAEAALRTRYGLSLMMVVRPGPMGTRRYLHPRADLVLEPDDRLYLQGDEVHAWNCAETELLQFGLAGPRTVERMLGRGMTLAEVSVPPRSQAVGHSLTDLHFRSQYHGNVLLLWRGGRTIHRDATQIPLEVGDVLLVTGSVEGVRELGRNPDFIVLTDQSAVEDVHRAPLAIALLLVALVPPILGWVPIAISALASALLMVVTGCLSRAGLRRAVDWKVLALIVGTIPLGAALESTGVASEVAGGILTLVAGHGEIAVLGALFALAAVTAMLSTNAAAAVIVMPGAVRAAGAAGMGPRLALLAVAFGCSTNFLSPFAQWNLLVMAPGGYRARDYLKVGVGQFLVFAAATLVCLALLSG